MAEIEITPGTAPEKPKRKTHTSTAVKARYDKKTYKKYTFSLRLVNDAELIKAVEALREPEESDSALIKKILYKLLDP